MNSRHLALLLPALLLGACSTTSRTGLVEDTAMGEAMRQSMAAQVIDPEPEYASDIEPSSGDHAAQAVERYRKGTVKKPERVRSTATGPGGN